MPAGATVEVVGGRQLRRTLKEASENLEDLKAVHAAIAAQVADLAASRAPRRSGALAGTVRGNRAAAVSRVMAGKAAVPYAGAIHWGWPARNISPNPFISEAASDSEAEILMMFEQGIQKVISAVEGV
jgi:hypothetical protein